MSRIDILIVEDNPLVAREMKIVLLENGYNVLKTVDSGEAALEVVKESSPDVIIMDINLKGDFDGVTTAEHIAEISPTPIVYLTGHSDKTTYNRAKKTMPEAFLSKPFNDQDLTFSIDLALQNFMLKKGSKKEQVEEENNHYLLEDTVFVRNDNKFEKVKISEILFVAAEGSYSTINTRDKRIILSQNLSLLSKKLNHPSLIRVHRSYIVNADQIESFKPDKIFIAENEIPVSKRYKDVFLERINYL